MEFIIIFLQYAFVGRAAKRRIYEGPFMSKVFNMLYDVQSQKILITNTFLEIVNLELYDIHILQNKYETRNVSKLHVL
jgi:hypothetical protein